jgi:hypothetical protein
MKGKKFGILALLVLLSMCLFTMPVFANRALYYSVTLPVGGFHTNLLESDIPDDNYCTNNSWGPLAPSAIYYDYWVDQQDNGQILSTTTILSGGYESVVKTYNKNNNKSATARASMRSLFDPSAGIWGYFTY